MPHYHLSYPKILGEVWCKIWHAQQWLQADSRWGGSKIHVHLNANKTNMLLPTGGRGAIDDRQQNHWIMGSGGVIHLCAPVVVKWQDHKAWKVAPVAIKVAVPIAKDVIDDGAQIKLGAESVDHHAAADARCNKSSLDLLKCMSAFRRLHGQIDNWVELEGHLVILH